MTSPLCRAGFVVRNEPQAAGIAMPANTFRSAAARVAAHILRALFACCLAGSLAPRADAAADDWLPINREDLAMKSSPADPAAHAMILYSETREDLQSATASYYVRIKIFDDAGLKYANAEVRHWSEAFFVEELYARTILPDGHIEAFEGRLFPTRKRNINGTYLAVPFTCPAATPGSIVEYRYRVEYRAERAVGPVRMFALSRNLSQVVSDSRFFDWPVQGELFVRLARYTLRPGQNSLQGAQLGPATGMRAVFPEYRTGNLPPNTAVSNEKLGTLVLEARDVPALPEEPSPPPLRELQGHIEMYFPQHKPESRRDFWGRYSSFVHAQQTEALKSLKLAHTIAEETVASGDAPEASLRKLYARAQKIRNRAYIIPPEGAEKESAALPLYTTAEDVLKRGEGTTDSINLAFLALALAAGFDAQMLRLAPRNLLRFNLDSFDPSQLSATAVWVRLGGKELVLDPGTPFCPYGLLPWPKASAGGFRIAKDDIVALTTPGLDPRESRAERKAELELSPDGSLSGSIRADFYGEESLELRIEALGMEERERRRVLIERFEHWLPQGTSVELISVTGWDSNQDPLRSEFRISIPAPARGGGRLSVALAATVAGRANPFESVQRAHAVSLPYPYRETDEITIALPPGIRVENLPPLREARLMLPGQIVSAPENGEATGLRRRQPGDVAVAVYQSIPKVGDNSITVARTLQVGITDVPVAHYSRLREFFQQVQVADRETVVFRASPATPN